MTNREPFRNREYLEGPRWFPFLGFMTFGWLLQEMWTLLILNFEESLTFAQS